MSLSQLHQLREVARSGNFAEIEKFFNASAQLKQMHIRIDLSNMSEPQVCIDEVMEVHKGGIGTEAVNGAVIALLVDLAIGLLGIRHYAEGMTATSNFNINYVKPLMANKVVVRAEETEVIGKRIFGIARVMNEKGEVCAYATGSLASGIVVG
ncbi:MAG: PaaI family thioesterase [Bacteroidetes bacterium]|nr:PaaI family thioesterase [Bacteroidota bacterium]